MLELRRILGNDLVVMDQRLAQNACSTERIQDWIDGCSKFWWRFVLTLMIAPPLTRLKVVLYDQLANTGVESKGIRKSKLQFHGPKYITPTS